MRTVVALLSTLFAAAALAAEEPPIETVGMGVVIGFLVLFALIIAGFVYMTARSSKKESEDQRTP